MRIVTACGLLVNIAILAFVQPIRADLISVDFETFTAMPHVPYGVPVPPDARLSDQLVASHGVRFASGSPFVAVVDIGAAATSGTQGIGGVTADGLLTFAVSPPIEVTFWDRANPELPAATDFVFFRIDLWATSGGRPVSLIAYDISGTIIASVTRPDEAGAIIAVSGEGIHRVAFFNCGDQDGVALDDLSFNPPVTIQPTPVRSISHGNLKRRYRR